MFRRWAGPFVTILILGGIALILVLNLNPRGARSSSDSLKVAPAPSSTEGGKAEVQAPGGAGKSVPFREYPIGDPTFKNHMKVAAVWLPPIGMDGMVDANGSDLIHLEADIHATEENPNGFALGEFVPYLKVRYAIAPAAGGAPFAEGELVPMVARDGLHYGASVALPKSGTYRLSYEIKPPSAGGLGRHSDAATGVAPWWEPFHATFEWDYPGPPRAGAPPAA